MYFLPKLKNLVSMVCYEYDIVELLSFTAATVHRRGFSRALSQHYMSISDEVNEALYANKPVVALESTILTHGMPYPDNLRYPFINGAI